MSLGLAMLLRDEATTIERCLSTIAPLVDRFTFVDTGSTDGTLDIAERILRDAGAYGDSYEREWVDSAHNTSELLAYAQDSADWLLLLHGDMTVDRWELPPEILAAPAGLPVWRCHDAYLVPEQNMGLTLSTVKLVRGDWLWRYEGRCHEHIETDHPYTVGHADGCLVTHHRDRQSKTSNADILAALQADLAEKPGDARTLFYIAQTLAEMGRWREAIACYRMRLAVPGWDEETFYARYRLGCLLAEHIGYAEGARELIAAWEMRPGRVEPLRALAYAATDIADRAPTPGDLLFVHRDAYRDTSSVTEEALV